MARIVARAARAASAFGQGWNGTGRRSTGLGWGGLVLVGGLVDAKAPLLERDLCHPWRHATGFGSPCPTIRGRAFGRPRGRCRASGLPHPSLAARDWLRIALTGHPWPGVRQTARQMPRKRSTSPILGGTRLASDRPDRPSVAGRSADRAAVPRKRSTSPIPSDTRPASDRPARPSVAGRSADRAAVPRKGPLRQRDLFHPWRYATGFGSPGPAIRGRA